MKNDIAEARTRRLIDKSILEPMAFTLSTMTRCKVELTATAIEGPARPTPFRLRGKLAYVAGIFTYSKLKLCVLFSDEAVFEIMDLLAGGQEAHRTIIENKVCSEVDLVAFDLIFKSVLQPLQQRLGKQVGYDDTLIGNAAAKSIMHMKDCYEVNAELRGVKGAYAVTCIVPRQVPESVSTHDIDTALEPSPSAAQDWRKILDGKRGALLIPDADAAAWLSDELPQTGALILYLMDKKQAARVDMLLPHALSVDLGVRFINMHEPNPEMISILLEIATQRHMIQAH